MAIKLIVGLANPGTEYAATRHNAGAWYVDLLAERLRAPLREEPKFFGYTSRITLEGEDVRLLVPTTFMNLSGKAVGAMVSFTVFSRTKFGRSRRAGSLRAWRNLNLAAATAATMV